MSKIEVNGAKMTEDQLVETGHQLIGRGGPYSSAESRVFGALWPIVRAAPLKTFADQLLARAARAHHVVERVEKVAIPTPYDTRIPAAQDALEEARENTKKAEEEFFAALDAHAKIGANRDASKAARAVATDRKRQAHHNFVVAKEAESHAMARVNSLVAASGQWRYTEDYLAEH